MKKIFGSILFGLFLFSGIFFCAPSVRAEGKDPLGDVLRQSMHQKPDHHAQVDNNLTPAMKNGKWGYRDSKGKWAIAPQFDSAEKFSNGTAHVSMIRPTNELSKEPMLHSILHPAKTVPCARPGSRKKPSTFLN